MSVEAVPRQIQDPAKVTFVLCHIHVESLCLHYENILVQVGSPRPRECICSASFESVGRSTKGEQHAAWPPVCLYLWFDEGIYK